MILHIVYGKTWEEHRENVKKVSGKCGVFRFDILGFLTNPVACLSLLKVLVFFCRYAIQLLVK